MNTNDTLTETTEPSKKFKVIYADPPWDIQQKGARGAAQHYDLMTLDRIKDMPVAELADDNATLLLWVTNGALPAGLEVMKAWGFIYKTKGFNWVKTNRDGTPFTGMGFWTRANPEDCLLGINVNEDCLLGTTGSPKRDAKNVRRLVMSPRREHSRKPDEIREDIERLVPGPYVELFARHTKPGWDAWGNQTTRFNPPAFDDLLGEAIPTNSTSCGTDHIFGDLL